MSVVANPSPAQWEMTISGVLTSAGFQVAVTDCTLPNGDRTRQYSCTRDGRIITLTELPLPGDSTHVAILGACRPKHTAALVEARDALTQHGALDSDAYHRTRL